MYLENIRITILIPVRFLKLVDFVLFHIHTILCFLFCLSLSQQYAAEQQFITTTDSLVATRTSLKLQLQTSHFHGLPPSAIGGLTLRCIAEIPNLYYLESTEVELGVPQRDPVPARGKCNISYLNIFSIVFA